MVSATLFVFSIFGAQLFWIQGINASAVSAEALKERLVVDQTIPALRGRILDSNGVVLASSLERLTVSVNQKAVCTYGTGAQTCDPATSAAAVARAASSLSPLLKLPANQLVPLMTGTAIYQILAKNVTPLTWRQIAALGVPGIGIAPHDRTAERSYPQSTTAASLVGFVTNEGKKAGGGIELLEDAVLAGVPGSQSYEQAAGGGAIPDGHLSMTPAVPGRDVQLTINSNIQWYAQNALAQAVQQTQALSGTVVALDVKTGKLLAVASYPTFDPNNVGQATGSLSNLAFTDVFEPGSTQKVITMASALSEGKVTPSTPIVIPSQLHRSDGSFHDAESHGTEYRTVAGALAESSNMGTMLVGETVPSSTLYDYMRKFGLGSTSGSKFPGESAGLLTPSDKWSGTQRYTVMYGQGLSVTAIQAAGVYQTIANGGVRMPPRLVEAVADDSGTLVPQPAPTGIRVLSPTIATEMSQMLEGVVSKDGTAPAAQIAGYRVAGKTGTADRTVTVGTGQNARGVYQGKTASFIGYAPADKPQIVLAVILQRPVKGYYGGTVAAPVFHDVMTYALQELKIP
ncbi:MAG: penicillin-binding protein 2, partial [Nostocoides sp.]